jgi:hypothetical protein
LKFNVGHWYAKKLANFLRLKYPKKNKYYTRREDLIILVTRYLLYNRIVSHFPNINPNMFSKSRFLVYPMDLYKSMYIIIDRDLDIMKPIKCSLLENPLFDLIGWYLNVIMENRNYFDKYMLQHKYFYHPIPEGYEDPWFSMPSLSPAYDDKDSLSLMLAEEVALLECIDNILSFCQPYPGDDNCNSIDPTYSHTESRFIIEKPMEWFAFMIGFKGLKLTYLGTY